MQEKNKNFDIEAITHYNSIINKEEHNMKPLMLAINPTAIRVGLSAYIIRKWARNGTIKAVRAGNKIYVNNNSLDEYLATHTLMDNVNDQIDGIKPISAKL